MFSIYLDNTKISGQCPFLKVNSASLWLLIIVYLKSLLKASNPYILINASSGVEPDKEGSLL